MRAASVHQAGGGSLPVPWPRAGGSGYPAAPTPTCVIADAIQDQADSQGLALHPVSVLREGLENKAGIVNDPGRRCFPKVSPRHHLPFCVFLTGPLAGESVNRQSLTSSQLTFPFNIKLFLYSGNVLQTTSYFCFYFIVRRIAVSLHVS